ncbi:UDP-glucoronosyl and UDP-glucosyl transferase domain-containing protein [Ditylenchus destructor]|nr:UDP-glucoronosyl and UDP-glucosyl transferase domain-containing protein [Ditylenchus destructor]
MRKHDMLEKEDMDSLSMDEIHGWYLGGNITFGNPPKRFYVEIDFFEYAELTLIGSNASLANVKKYYLPKQTFNSSSSTSYSEKDGNFSLIPCYGFGHLGSDVLTIGNISSRVTVGIHDKIGWCYEDGPTDGRLGLSTGASKLGNNAPSLLREIVGQLYRPIFSIWHNRTRDGTGEAQLTLGAEDTKHCWFDWAYASRVIVSNYNGYSYNYAVNATQIRAFNSNGSLAASWSNTTLVNIRNDLYSPSASIDVFNLFLNASSTAVYESKIGKWVVDCDLSKIGNVVISIGNELLDTPGMIEKLRAEKFDVYIGEQLTYCGSALSHLAGIPIHILVSSCPMQEHIATAIGLPLESSYVPTLLSADYSDQMTYWERIENFFLTIAASHSYTSAASRLTEIFRKRYGNDFPEINDIVKNSPLIFVNIDEYVDFPRPTFHNIVNIGGLGITKGSTNSLQEPYKSEMEKGKSGVVFFSLGSLVETLFLDPNFKRNMFAAFQSLNDFHFVVKIDKKDKESHQLSENIGNVFTTSWAPQTDILAHPRLRLFISHCGYNSLMETALNGVPVLCMGFFADQMRNGRVAERNGWGLAFDKLRLLSDHTEFLESVRELLTNSSYAVTARRTQKLIKSKPMSAEERLQKSVRFLEENGGKLPEILPHVNGRIHIIEAKYSKLSDKHVKIRTLQRREHLMRKHDMLEKEDMDSLSMDEIHGWYLGGNITFGNPPKRFYVEIDFFEYAELTLIGSNASLANVKKYYLPKQTFNSSSSTSYSEKDGNFSLIPCYGFGHLGSDVLTIGNISSRVTVGIHDKIGWCYEDGPTDGRLGLSTGASKLGNNAPSLLREIVGQLDRPIFSIWHNRTRDGTGEAQLTLGAEDTKHCWFDWAYAPRVIVSNYNGYSYNYAVNATQIRAFNSNGSLAASWPNTTLVNLYSPSASIDVFNLFLNASSTAPVYESKIGKWVVNCDLTKIGKVVISIGNSANIVLTPSDFIVYNVRY